MVRHHEGVRPGWRWDDDWRKRRYMDWLITPITERDPPSKQKLADLLGVDVRTLRGWSEHPQFRAEWDQRVSKIIGDPDRAQNVIETLYRAATDPKNRQQVQAAKLYLEATNSIKPAPVEVKVVKATDLTDAELDELLALGAAELKQQNDGR